MITGSQILISITSKHIIGHRYKHFAIERNGDGMPYSILTEISMRMVLYINRFPTTINESGSLCEFKLGNNSITIFVYFFYQTLRAVFKSLVLTVIAKAEKPLFINCSNR